MAADSHTGVVPAAASGGPHPPRALELGEVPAPSLAARQRVGGQVADVKAGKVTQEVRVGHPAGGREEHAQ